MVRELSEGFTDDEWISAVATPVLGELLRTVVWPSDLTTVDGTAMIIRETTHRFSRLSFHRAMVGRRMPLLYSASGRAYLAFCPEEERAQLLQLLIAAHDENPDLHATQRWSGAWSIEYGPKVMDSTTATGKQRQRSVRSRCRFGAAKRYWAASTSSTSGAQ
jgi:hypothetical protein